ncbi:glutaredoxin family protein [Patescibacteria group bacterium]
MKTYILSKAVLLILVLFLGLVFPVRIYAEGVVEEESSDELILFVQEGCQYCEKVEEFLQDKELTDKVQILDIIDPVNAALYNQMSEIAGIPLEQRGVPLLFSNGEAIQSADEIIEFLGEKFEVSTEGYDFNNDNGEEKEISVTVLLVILGSGVLGSVLFLIFSKKREK